MSKWLTKALAAYHGLVTPIVDWTVGLVPWAFGYHLLPAAKDIIAIYLIFAFAELRIWQRYSGRIKEVHGPDGGRLFTVFVPVTAILWPLFLVFEGTREMIHWRSSNGFTVWTILRIGILGAFALELARVLAIVAVAIALNAADVLL